VNVLLIVIGLSLVGVAAWFVIRAIAVPRLRIDAHLKSVDSYGFETGVLDTDLPTGRERRNVSLNQFAAGIGRTVIGLIPSLQPLRRGELTAAGMYTTSVEAVHGYRVLAAVFAPLLVLAYAAVLSGSISLIAIAVAVLAVALGWYGPVVAIRQRGRERLATIDRELPELIDLLVATIEAGLGLGASLRLVAGRFEGPLGDELQLTLHQQGLGISNEAAMADLVERVDTPSMRSFTRTVLRAETLGMSIGPIMRNLAVEMRRRRRHTAQERIQKTPIKMLFPLILLIFPALFIVLLYPAAYTIIHELGS
jgi:tight adherence protein C